MKPLNGFTFFFLYLHFLKIILACGKWSEKGKEHEQGGQTESCSRNNGDLDQWQRTYISKIHFGGRNDQLGNMRDMGGYGRYGGYGRMKSKDRLPRFPAWAEQVVGLCHDLWWEPQPHLSDKPSTVHSVHSLPWMHQKQGSKMNLTCVRERGSHLGNQRALYEWLHWLNSMRLFPKDQVNFSAEDSGNPLVELPLSLTKQQMSCCQPYVFWRNKGHSIEESPFHVLECSDLSCI